MRVPWTIALRNLLIALVPLALFLAADAFKYGLGWHSVLVVALIQAGAAYWCAADGYEAGRRAEPPRLPDPPDWMVQEVQRRSGKGPEECRRLLTAPSLAEYWALSGDGPDDDFRHDPIEANPAYAAALLRATLEAEREVGESGEEGHCHEFWAEKQRLLLKRFGVRWESPADMNPESEFD
jgi:hypothetical protein